MHRYNIDDFILFDINSINFLLIIFYLILYYIDAKEETLNMIIEGTVILFIKSIVLTRKNNLSDKDHIYSTIEMTWEIKTQLRTVLWTAINGNKNCYLNLNNELLL